MKASFRLGRIAGIEIGIHYTWLIAFALVTWTLAQGFFPNDYPGWNPLTYWITGAASSLSLFLSVLVHELAHSFVAKARGLRVQGITLFIFGGVSNLGTEAARALDEFFISVVGPLTSFALAAAFLGLHGVVGDPSGPLAAGLHYLWIVNLLLAVFNILPGFPLDGGRVLRSAIWGATHSLSRATTVAATVGQVVAFGFIAIGVFQVLQGQFLSGLWIAFIGWFLNGAADSSRREVATQEQLRRVPATAVMDAAPETVAPDTLVSDLVTDGFLRRGRRALPVCEDGSLLGIATLTDVKHLPQDRWATTRVREIMTRSPLHAIRPTDDLATALRMLAEHNINQVVVMRDGTLAGLLTRADLIRYLQFREELGLRPER